MSQVPVSLIQGLLTTNHIQAFCYWCNDIDLTTSRALFKYADQQHLGTFYNKIRIYKMKCVKIKSWNEWYKYNMNRNTNIKGNIQSKYALKAEQKKCL